MEFQRVTKTEILNRCFFRRFLLLERDTRLNDQLDKPKLHLYAFQHLKVYWSGKLTFAVWELAPNDHLKHFVFISLPSMDINVKYCTWEEIQNSTHSFRYHLWTLMLNMSFEKTWEEIQNSTHWFIYLVLQILFSSYLLRYSRMRTISMQKWQLIQKQSSLFF